MVSPTLIVIKAFFNQRYLRIRQDLLNLLYFKSMKALLVKKKIVLLQNMKIIEKV